MNTFLISFEFLPPSFSSIQEKILVNHIKSFGSWANPTSNLWLIKTYSSKEMVMNKLRTGIGPRDRLLIMKVTNEWISFNLQSVVVDWMKSKSL